jgi:hypothetical protein
MDECKRERAFQGIRDPDYDGFTDEWVREDYLFN